jgi:hypothetical protein
MSDPVLFLKRPNEPDEWVDGSESCLGKHHLYVPVEPPDGDADWQLAWIKTTERASGVTEVWDWEVLVWPNE